MQSCIRKFGWHRVSGLGRGWEGGGNASLRPHNITLNHNLPKINLVVHNYKSVCTNINYLSIRMTRKITNIVVVCSISGSEKRLLVFFRDWDTLGFHFGFGIPFENGEQLRVILRGWHEFGYCATTEFLRCDVLKRGHSECPFWATKTTYNDIIRASLRHLNVIFSMTRHNDARMSRLSLRASITNCRVYTPPEKLLTYKLAHCLNRAFLRLDTPNVWLTIRFRTSWIRFQVNHSSRLGPYIL